MEYFHGFNITKEVTFNGYNSVVTRTLRYNSPPAVMTLQEYHSLPCPVIYHSPIPELTSVGLISFDEIINRIGSIFEPAFKLNLSVMAVNNLLPKTFKESCPDLDLRIGCYDTAPFEVTNPDGALLAIADTILTNLHYGHRVHALARKFGMSRRHPNGIIRMPDVTDQAAKDIVEREAENAFQRKWHDVLIFQDELGDGELGLASWLWTDVKIHDALVAGQRFQASGSVLFTYAPHWMIPEESVLNELSKFAPELEDTSEPEWIAGIRGYCRLTGTHDLVIYNGNHIVLGVLDATFEGVQFSAPLLVDGPNMELDANDITVFQILLEVMARAESSDIVPAPDANQAPAPVPATPVSVPQVPAVHTPSSSSGCLKRQREDEDVSPTSSRADSPRASGSSTSRTRHRQTRSTRTTRAHNATAGPSRQRRVSATVAQAPSDEELSPPAKRLRITPDTTDAPVAPSTPAPVHTPVPTTIGNAAHPDEGPPATRRPVRAAKNGTTYAERQAKLADASNSQKRADLKNKAKAVKAAASNSKRPTVPVVKLEDVEEGALAYDSANEGDLMEVDEPQLTAVPTPKAKAVAAPKNTRRTKKAAAVKESSKKAMVQATKVTKAKTATMKATVIAEAPSDDASTLTGMYRSTRSRAALEANEPPVASGKGKAKEKGKGVPTRRQPPRK
ncbi:hypothetical protein FRB94_002655 [Tulasnella sp. JGI-2019a]|nr:hypothetical protein FRB93_005162 [Tulasnella sp. JGI-2019a]KAG9004172.1 hypothetical protein FRB94_002655 [Tulasnella sp. JGI-2019a]KAG9031022.1 hypothetical protein FRB95_003248 [Tulasnella sp. JGI-2019a]